MAKAESFEDALKRLEEIVRELEKGDIGIDEALVLFEEGTGLTKLCARKLANVEKRVEILKKNEKGEEVLELFQDMEEN
jgi:exodeoxyribonuclease VII small subunit